MARVDPDARVHLTFALHVQPGAKRSELAGMHGDALRVRLAAPAVDGKANAELIRLLADAFGVPRRNVEIVRGATSRAKVVRIVAPTRRPQDFDQAASALASRT